MSNNSMIAPCGIDCSECEIYRAARNPELAEQTAQRWRETWQPKAEASWFVCQGCRGDRTLCWSEACKIYSCCMEQHGLSSCSECDEFPCAEYEAWAAEYPNHGKAFERLKAMREQEDKK